MTSSAMARHRSLVCGLVAIVVMQATSALLSLVIPYDVAYVVTALMTIAWLVRYRRGARATPARHRRCPRSLVVAAVLCAIGGASAGEWLLACGIGWSDLMLTGAVLAPQTSVLAICVLAPILEELAFRGCCLDEDASPRMVVTTAVLFAVAHLNPAQMPLGLLLGLALGAMRRRTGGIACGIVVHVMTNLLTAIPYVAAALSLMRPVETAACVVAGLALVIRDLRGPVSTTGEATTV